MRQRLQWKLRRRPGPAGRERYARGPVLATLLGLAVAAALPAAPVLADGSPAPASEAPAQVASALPPVALPPPALEAGRAWRSAREQLNGARALAPGTPGRRQAVLEARDEARRAARLAPDCAECCLYEFAATAQLAAGGGHGESLGFAREAGRVLERCLAAPPTTVNADGSSEAAKLYYGASQYFRRLPHSRLLRWTLGLGGDAERAAGFARHALLLEPDNDDYRAELAAALLCRADHGGGDAERAEAADLLRRLRETPSARARTTAEDLAAATDDACGWGEPFPGAAVAQGRR